MWRWLVVFLLAGCVNANAPQIGNRYVGARYAADPLGEGAGYDTDPLIRFDAFDCMTFVETAMADGNVDALNKIRYQNGIVGFINRNHFVATQWLTNNAARVENVSREYGKTSNRIVTNDIAAWLRVTHGIDTTISPITKNIEYIPYKNLNPINNTEPLIVLFIVGPRDDAKLATDIAVVHMGFLLPGGTILRHASSMYGRVMDANFHKYIESRKRMNNNIGIALVRMK